MSGGIDSSVTLGLCARAVGPDKVIALQMPERHSSEEALRLSGKVADTFGVEKIHEDISGTLEAVGFYHRYDECVASVISAMEKGGSQNCGIECCDSRWFTVFSVVAQSLMENR